MYFFSFMVGTAHYGLPVGRWFNKQFSKTVELEILTHKNLNTWCKYNLPPPCFLLARPKETCLICLIIFVLAPDLVTFNAFNHAGNAWGHGKCESGSLCITYLPGGEILIQISSPHDLQTALRFEFIKQQRLLGVEVVFSADDQVAKIPKKNESKDFNGDGNAEVDLGKDSTLVRRTDWW